MRDQHVRSLFWRIYLAILAAAAVLVAFWTYDAHAQVSKTFNWTNPTQYVNGTPLAPSNIRETRISVSSTPGGEILFVEVSPGSASEYVSLPIFSAGNWYARAQTVDVNGATSDYSNQATFSVGACEANPAGCTPLPPSNLTVQ